MKLKVKLLNLDAAGKTIVIINEHDAKELGVKPLDRIVLHKGRKCLTAVVNVTDKFVKSGFIVAYEEVKDELRLCKGDVVVAEPRETLISKKFIREKVCGGKLNYDKYLQITKDVIERDLNDLELASFITALEIHGLSVKEEYDMTQAMINTGSKLRFPGIVVDKHSIGGVPGDKTSMIVVPIIGAAGLTIPKTSSRSVTSPAGTADRMEVLAPVELSISKIQKIVKKIGCCLVWGGAVELAPADDLFIQIENPLNFDPLMLPSIMAKKYCAGSKYLVIDIPTGRGAKINTKAEARILGKRFINLGRKLGIKVDYCVTNGNQPLGFSMGPAAEAQEALNTLMYPNDAPSDVVDKAVTIAGKILKMVGKGGEKKAREILFSGKAEDKMREIIKEQGGNFHITPNKIKLGKHSHKVYATKSGRVSGINNKIIAKQAKTAGAPLYKKAGIILEKKIGDKVISGDVLYTIYSENREKLKKAVKMKSGYEVK